MVALRRWGEQQGRRSGRGAAPQWELVLWDGWWGGEELQASRRLGCFVGRLREMAQPPRLQRAGGRQNGHARTPAQPPSCAALAPPPTTHTKHYGHRPRLPTSRAVLSLPLLQLTARLAPTSVHARRTCTRGWFVWVGRWHVCACVLPVVPAARDQLSLQLP